MALFDPCRRVGEVESVIACYQQLSVIADKFEPLISLSVLTTTDITRPSRRQRLTLLKKDKQMKDSCLRNLSIVLLLVFTSSIVAGSSLPPKKRGMTLDSGRGRNSCMS